MPLYSTGTHTNAGVGKQDNGQGLVPDPEVAVCTETKDASPWCYLFIHHAKVDAVCKVMQRQYPVFVHKSIIYRREDRRIRREEKPTVSGLVFIQGPGKDIQEFLSAGFPGLSLARDCSTYRTAVIPDSIMQPFMQLSEVAPTRIRFMPHTLGYYSEGNPLIRITSGPLAGLEGYRIRIARDKCLVTTIGGMTVAIGGIHRDSFANMDEYVRQRRKQMKSCTDSSYIAFTPLQREIDSSLFTPQSRLDVMAVASTLTGWMMRVKSGLKDKDFDKATEIALFMLEDIGSRFRGTRSPRLCGMEEILDVCREADRTLLSVMGSEDVSTDLKEIAETGRESLAIRFPFPADRDITVNSFTTSKQGHAFIGFKS